jgi:hypothetical protein
MHQSGWDKEDTLTGAQGPYRQIGLIWANAASAARIAKVKNSAPVLAINTGNKGGPTSLLSRRFRPAHSVWPRLPAGHQVRGDQGEQQAG